MKARELRIGNWVYNEYLRKPQETYPMMIAQLATIEKDGKESSMSGIPLTPEWLERFGFENSASIGKSDSFYFIYVGGSELHINPINGVVWIERNENVFNNPALVTHVHQLQNLYFALTGEELTIENPTETHQ